MCVSTAQHFVQAYLPYLTSHPPVPPPLPPPSTSGRSMALRIIGDTSGFSVELKSNPHTYVQALQHVLGRYTDEQGRTPVYSVARALAAAECLALVPFFSLACERSTVCSASRVGASISEQQSGDWLNQRESEKTYPFYLGLSFRGHTLGLPNQARRCSILSHGYLAKASAMCREHSTRFRKPTLLSARLGA